MLRLLPSLLSTCLTVQRCTWLLVMRVMMLSCCSCWTCTLRLHRALITLPLHLAVSAPQSFAVCKALLSAHAKGAEAATIAGEMALHAAVQSHCSSDVVAMLVHAAPQAVQATAQLRRLPIHYAAMNGAAVEQLQLLADAFPEGLCQLDSSGSTALHLALAHGSPQAQVRFLLASAPEAAAIADASGRFPLHFAALSGELSEEVFAGVVAAHRDAVTAEDAAGRTPADAADSRGHSAIAAMLRDGMPHARLLAALPPRQSGGHAAGGSAMEEAETSAELSMDSIVCLDDVDAELEVISLPSPVIAKRRPRTPAAASTEDEEEDADFDFDALPSLPDMVEDVLAEEEATAGEAEEEGKEATPAPPAASPTHLSEETQRLLNDLRQQIVELRARLEGAAPSPARAAAASARAHIHRSPELTRYYRHFQSRLNEVYLACQVINSGLVWNGMTNKKDYALKGMQALGGGVPGVQLVLDALAGGSKIAMEKSKRLMVIRIARMATGPSAMENVAEETARLLACAHETRIRAAADMSERQLTKLKLKAVVKHTKHQSAYLYTTDAVELLALDDAATIVERIMRRDSALQADQPVPAQLIALLEETGRGGGEGGADGDAADGDFHAAVPAVAHVLLPEAAKRDERMADIRMYKADDELNALLLQAKGMAHDARTRIATPPRDNEQQLVALLTTQLSEAMLRLLAVALKLPKRNEQRMLEEHAPKDIAVLFGRPISQAAALSALDKLQLKQHRLAARLAASLLLPACRACAHDVAHRYDQPLQLLGSTGVKALAGACVLRLHWRLCKDGSDDRAAAGEEEAKEEEKEEAGEEEAAEDAVGGSAADEELPSAEALAELMVALIIAPRHPPAVPGIPLQPLAPDGTVWLAAALLEKCGVVTADGQQFAAVDGEAHRYGYRRGTAEEAYLLGMRPVIDTVAAAAVSSGASGDGDADSAGDSSGADSPASASTAPPPKLPLHKSLRGLGLKEQGVAGSDDSLPLSPLAASAGDGKAPSACCVIC
eukprot:PLAT8618.1.p1 GENE.PLAT8618.1~~PLAT8618.1.p1  ORF type:complete len:1012 (+),score=430.04 PLAT8618.1:820-3855(+)